MAISIYIIIIAICIQSNYLKFPNLYIRQSSGDFIYLKSISNGKCLRKSPLDGKVLYDNCSFYDDLQKIRIEKYKDYFLFKSTDNQVFDISGSNYITGNYIHFWNAHYGDGQLWIIDSLKIYNLGNRIFCLSV